MGETTVQSGRDQYDAIYRKDLAAEVEWLRLGATDKTDSIGFLLSQCGVTPDSILELGCGTGEVIKECQRRDYARRYAAIDYSEPAIQYLRDNSKGIDISSGDIASSSFAIPGHFDVVVLSHVIEHLDKPDEMLKALSRIDYSYLIAEVPLEDLPLCRLKSYLKDRTKNPAGHVQFFTAASFKALLGNAGIRPIRSRRYFPRQPAERIRFMCRKNGWGTAKQWQALMTGRYLPMIFGPLWSRMYYSHLAVICRKP
ncbi:MAG: class I SAM-dependent methyltransferase [Tepidisphaeraceae bacterium]